MTPSNRSVAVTPTQTELTRIDVTAVSLRIFGEAHLDTLLIVSSKYQSAVFNYFQCDTMVSPAYIKGWIAVAQRVHHANRARKTRLPGIFRIV